MTRRSRRSALDDEPDVTDTKERRRYLAVMAEYPKCACGQSLWAAASIERGVCEGCHKIGRDPATS
jgi:hypothetical protein